MRRVLILHDADSPPQPYLQLFAGFELQRAGWKSFKLDQGRDYHVDLIAPMAVGSAAWLTELLRWFRDKPITVPVFPILSTDANAGQLALVAEVAADFAVWPTQPNEVLQRVNRIIGRATRGIDLIGERLTNEIGLAQLVGREPAFLELISRIPLIAHSNSPVLITAKRVPVRS
jgi:DNA-binding NtrC family response regulator